MFVFIGVILWKNCISCKRALPSLSTCPSTKALKQNSKEFLIKNFNHVKYILETRKYVKNANTTERIQGNRIEKGKKWVMEDGGRRF